jgi:periplasmic protein TonB
VSVALGFPRPVRSGPALRLAPLPFGSLVLSAILHAGFIVAAVFAVSALKERQSEVYVVNLVPAIAAIGSPKGQASAPPVSRPVEPPRAEPPPRPEPAPREQPSRDVVSTPPRDLPPRNLAPRDLPPRELPARSRDAVALPDRPPAVRAPGPVPPRRDQKELPALGTSPTAKSSAVPPPPAASGTNAGTSVASAPTPPEPLGLPSGSTQGRGAITAEVDFPYAWYLRVVQQKISEKWEGRALPGNQPTIMFKIGRNGQVIGRADSEKSSGNPLYDRAAVRAVEEASPFPPLPSDFKGEFLRLHLGFGFGRTTDRG